MNHYKICRHIKTNGEQCNSPRLLDRDYCFFHHRMLNRHRDAVLGRRSAEVMLPILDKTGALVGMEPAPQQTLDLGLLEDRTSVQMAISTVLNALAAGRLHQQRATALLYGLQLASSNCPASIHNHGHAYEPVDEALDTPDGQSIAPEDRIPPAILHHHESQRQLEALLLTEDEDDDEEDC
jgi:hypothetical protein